MIAIDGKVLRSYHDRNNRQSSIQMVNTSSTANGVVLSQQKTDAKSNEITAVQSSENYWILKAASYQLMPSLQTDIASVIVDNGGHYLLAVRGYQETLAKDVRHALSDRISAVNTNEQSHAGVEAREDYELPASELAKQFPD